MTFPVRVEEIALACEGEMKAPFARVDCSAATADDVLEMCSDPSAIAKALTTYTKDNREARMSGEAAVYVVGNERGNASKIGISRTPASRLAGLQGGSPERLNFSHLFWMQYPLALHMEGVILAVADYQNRRAVGEWTHLPADRLGEMVAFALMMGGGVSFSDSTMACQNVRNIRNLDEKFDRHAARGFMRVSPEDVILENIDEGR